MLLWRLKKTSVFPPIGYGQVLQRRERGYTGAMTTPNDRSQFALQNSSITLDIDTGYVHSAHGNSLRLSPIAQKILRQLVVRAGELVTRNELFEAVWPNQLVSEDVLTRAISDLRSQLASLDSSIIYIETLPKRGYRWVSLLEALPSHPSVPASPDEPAHLPVRSESKKALPLARLRPSYPKVLMLCVCSGLLLSAVLMLAITEFVPKGGYRLAVLPTRVELPYQQLIARELDGILLEILRTNPQIELLSSSAVASRPANHFPYFFNEFNANWVLETRLSDLSGLIQVELSLVDARTGIERRHVRLEVVNPRELRNIMAKQALLNLLDGVENY